MLTKFQQNEISVSYILASLQRYLTNTAPDEEKLDIALTPYTLNTLINVIQSTRALMTSVIQERDDKQIKAVYPVLLKLIEQAEILQLSHYKKFKDQFTLEQKYTSLFYYITFARLRFFFECAYHYTHQKYVITRHDLGQFIQKSYIKLMQEKGLSDAIIKNIRFYVDNFDAEMDAIKKQGIANIKTYGIPQLQVSDEKSTASSTAAVATQLNTVASLVSAAQRRKIETYLYHQFYKITHIALPLLKKINFQEITHVINFDCDKTLIAEDHDKEELLNENEHIDFFKNLPKNSFVNMITGRGYISSNKDALLRIANNIEMKAGRKIFASIYFIEIGSKEFVLEDIRHAYVPHLPRNKIVLVDDMRSFISQCKLAGFHTIQVKPNTADHINQLNSFIGVPKLPEAIAPQIVNSASRPALA